jgi:hypothetical protein
VAVTPSTIAVALGLSTPVSTAQELQWSLWISEARLLIRARLGDLTLLDQGLLDYVVRQAVVAQVSKPDSSTQVDVAVDDARVSKRYSSSPGRVSILDEWWEDTSNWRTVPYWLEP